MTTLVQGPLSAASGSGATSIAKAFTSDVTAGNAIIVVVRWTDESAPRQGSSFGVTVSDDLSNTYALAIQSSSYDDGTVAAAIFSAKNISGGACTVTASFDQTASRQEIMIFEVSGLDTAAPQEATNSATGTSAAPDAGSVVSASGGFLVAIAMNASNYSSFTAGTGWTGDSTTAIYNKALVEHRIEAAGGTFTGDFSQSSSTAWAAIAAAFKAAGGGGGGSFQAARAANSTVTISSGARGA